MAQHDLTRQTLPLVWYQQGKGQQQMKKLELTENQINQLLWAIELTQNSYQGYTDQELKDYGVKRDLATLKQVADKLENI